MARRGRPENTVFAVRKIGSGYAIGLPRSLGELVVGMEFEPVLREEGILLRVPAPAPDPPAPSWLKT